MFDPRFSFVRRKSYSSVRIFSLISASSIRPPPISHGATQNAQSNFLDFSEYSPYNGLIKVIFSNAPI